MPILQGVKILPWAPPKAHVLYENLPNFIILLHTEVLVIRLHRSSDAKITAENVALLCFNYSFNRYYTQKSFEEPKEGEYYIRLTVIEVHREQKRLRCLHCVWLSFRSERSQNEHCDDVGPALSWLALAWTLWAYAKPDSFWLINHIDFDFQNPPVKNATARGDQSDASAGDAYVEWNSVSPFYCLIRWSRPSFIID